MRKESGAGTLFFFFSGVGGEERKRPWSNHDGVMDLQVLGRRREYFFLLHPKDVKENQIGLCMVYPINEKRKESKILSMSDGRSVKVEEDHSGRPLISSPTAQERKRERPVEDDEVDGGYLAVESGAKCLEKIKDPLSPGGGRARNGRVSPSKSANNVSSPPRKRGFCLSPTDTVLEKIRPTGKSPD